MDIEGSEVGIVGQDGRIIMRGLSDSGRLTAEWGDDEDQTCQFTYELPVQTKNQGHFAKIEAVCVSSARLTQESNAIQIVDQITEKRAVR